MQYARKILITISAIMLVLFLMTGMAYAEGTKTGIITGNNVNFRSNPDISSKVISQLLEGTKVTVISDSGDWYKVSCSDATGWIYGKYVTIRDAAIAAGIINASTLNVRSEPNTSSEILTQIDKGTTVNIAERLGDWYRISLDQEDKCGWVYKDYVTIRNDTVSRGSSSDTGTAVTPESGNSTDSAAAETDLRQRVVDYAKEFLGVRYVYGGSSPKGFDCSGFVQYVFKHFGIDLERTAAEQSRHGTAVSRANLKPGDLVFFDTNGGHNSIEHVGIYIGGGKFIQASSGTGTHKVVISGLTSGYYNKCYMRARRYIS